MLESWLGGHCYRFSSNDLLVFLGWLKHYSFSTGCAKSDQILKWFQVPSFGNEHVKIA